LRRHGRRRARRLKQLDGGSARGQHRHTHALIFDRLRVHDLKPQRVAPEPQRVVNAFRRDADVFNFHFRMNFRAAGF